jgi:predicted DNA-binding transcriptional regulator AlpA
VSRGTSPEAVQPRRPGSLLGTAELEAELGVPRSTISRWLKSGVLPRPEESLRATPVWRRRDIDRFKERRAKKRAAQEEKQLVA